MKRLTNLVVLVLFATNLVGQNRNLCETDASTVDMQEYYFNTLFEQQLVAQKQYNGIEWIPIQIHILVRNDGSGRVPLNELQWELDTLNARFGRDNMRFYQCAPINFIKNSALYDSSFSSNKAHACNGTTPEYTLANNNVLNVVNIYLIDSSNTSHAHFPSDRTSRCADWIILNKGQLQWYGVLAHEMGHYLDLFHTFNGARKAADREHITRSSTNPCYNCLTVGDLLCDTEADPDTLSSGSWNAACNFTMTTRDSLCGNGLFTPWEENIMSYSVTCSHFFTAGQFTRMKAAIAGSRSYLTCGALADCFANLNFSGIPAGGNRYFQVENAISSTANLQFGNFIVYDAGNVVTLLPGFVSSATGTRVFKAFIDGCYGDRIFDRNTQSADSLANFTLVKTDIGIQSSLYSSLPANALYYLTVSDEGGRLIYKKTFRNFSKASPVDFFHNARGGPAQIVRVYSQQHQLLLQQPVPQ